MTMKAELTTDFVLWFTDPADPDGFVSLHPQTPRAMQWRKEHGFRSTRSLDG
jgi:hypothetical protein